jgi:hypothetical protein
MFYSDDSFLLLIAFLGDFLLRSLLKAILMKAKHTLENNKFDATLSQALRDEWLTMIRNWESDKSSPNPYTHNEKGTMSVNYRNWLPVLMFT